jgi:hypothetical protein
MDNMLTKENIRVDNKACCAEAGAVAPSTARRHGEGV